MRPWLFLATFFLTLTASAQRPTPVKRVEIDKTDQILRAYEADKFVIQTNVSTGKWDRSTPNGQFAAQSKQRIHYSKLFKNAPMPYSVEVVGNVFIHGFSSVPKRPASHGCIRVPKTGANPAKQFFEWAEVGTPITITGQWPG